MSSISSFGALLGLVAMAIFLAVRETDSSDDLKGASTYMSATSMADRALVTYLKMIDCSDRTIAAVTSDKGSAFLLVKKTNDSHHEIRYTIAKRTVHLAFEPGKPFVGGIVGGRNYSQTITLDGEDYRRVIKMGSYETIQEAKFFEDGVNVTLEAKNAVAVIEFQFIPMRRR